MILGGAQEHVVLLCEGLARRGHDVVLVTGPALGPEGQLMDRACGGGYRVVELNCLRRAVNPFYDVAGYLKLKKLLKQLDPDIVHTNSAKAGILGRLAAGAIKKGNRPLIVHTVHGLSFHPYQSAILNRFYITAERIATKHTGAFISVADAMTEKCLAVGIGKAEQFVRIFSGMETQHYLDQLGDQRITEIRREFDIPDDAIVITTVARLFELKGHEYIIASAKKLAMRHKNVIWMFVGDGNLREQLARQIAEAGLTERFRFTGLVAPRRVGELLHASDILAHPSLREGLPRTFPQAMLCGKPVISFDIDGAKEVVNERTGILVEPEDVQGLIDAQDKLIGDADLREQLGAAGRRFCRREFDHELMVEKTEKFYKDHIIQ